MKKMMLLALAAASVAMFALPAVASAQSWHISSTGAFSITGNAGSSLSTTTGETITCAGGIGGKGEYETTTTGWIEVTFTGTCNTTFFGFPVHCSSPAPETNNSIVTTKLPFHNIMIAAGTPGVLITPSSAGSFAHFSCAGQEMTVTGNGVIGHVEKACGSKAATAGINFVATSHGVQQFQTYTGVTYRLKKGEAFSAQNATGTVNFGTEKTITCT